MNRSFQTNLQSGLCWLAGLAVIGATSPFAAAGSRSSTSYTISADTIDSGGGRSTSTAYTHDGSAGILAAQATGGVPVTTLASGYVAQFGLPAGITTQPVKQQVAEGGTVTLIVTAGGTPPFSYQWRRNNVPLSDGGRVSGAATDTLAITGALPGDTGIYSVVVTSSEGSVISTGVPVGVVPTGTTVAHAVPGGGYLAGGTVTISNSITYVGSVNALSWNLLLPSGWSYLSSSGAAGQTQPVAGATSVLDWGWTTVPSSPVSFSYTLSVPAGFTGTANLVALATLTQNGIALQVVAKPDPLPVPQITTHTADTDRNRRFSLLELTRVIELYNTRLGTQRTGRYKVQANTEDGFGLDPVSTTNQPLAAYHSADSNRDGAISLYELTRVIELYNYRAGTVRTGQYRVQANTEDGFAPGP